MHTETHSNTLQHTGKYCNTMQHAAARCNTLQHTATHCHKLLQRVVNTGPAHKAFPQFVQKLDIEGAYLNRQFFFASVFFLKYPRFKNADVNPRHQMFLFRGAGATPRSVPHLDPPAMSSAISSSLLLANRRRASWFRNSSPFIFSIFFKVALLFAAVLTAVTDRLACFDVRVGSIRPPMPRRRLRGVGVGVSGAASDATDASSSFLAFATRRSTTDLKEAFTPSAMELAWVWRTRVCVLDSPADPVRACTDTMT